MEVAKIDILIQSIEKIINNSVINFAREYYYFGKICKKLKCTICDYPRFIVELKYYKSIDNTYATLIANYLLQKEDIAEQYVKDLKNYQMPREIIAYYGGATVDLTLPSEIINLNSKALSNGINLVSYNTGVVNNYHYLAVEEDIELLSVLDVNASNADLKLFFSSSNLVISGRNYILYKMVSGVPYLTSHNFRFNVRK